MRINVASTSTASVNPTPSMRMMVPTASSSAWRASSITASSSATGALNTT